MIVFNRISKSVNADKKKGNAWHERREISKKWRDVLLLPNYTQRREGSQLQLQKMINQ